MVKYPIDNVVTKRKSVKLASRLGKNIANRRKDIGLTQDQLAEQVGVDTETISRFERGVTTPSLATLEVLSKKLGITIAVLLDEAVLPPSDDAQMISVLMSTLKGKERTFLIELIQLYCQQHG